MNRKNIVRYAFVSVFALISGSAVAGQSSVLDDNQLRSRALIRSAELKGALSKCGTDYACRNKAKEDIYKKYPFTEREKVLRSEEIANQNQREQMTKQAAERQIEQVRLARAEEEKLADERRAHTDEKLKAYAPILLVLAVVLASVSILTGFGWLAAFGWVTICAWYYWLFLVGGYRELALLLLPIFAVVAVVWRGFWVRGRKLELNKAKVDAGAFLPEGNGTTFSVGKFSVSVDVKKLLITVNDYVTLSPLEFSYHIEEITRQRTYNTGSTQSVTKNGQHVGDVYIPGESGSYEVTVGYQIRIYRSGNEVLKYVPRWKDDYELVRQVLVKLDRWCESVAQKSAGNVLDTLCAKAGMDKEFLSKTRWSKEGALLETIAVDRAGKAVAVYNNGADTWFGALKGASAQIVGSKLEIKVDDPAYREQHLTERRFAILEKEFREVLMEWEDRINLLAKKATDAA